MYFVCHTHSFKTTCSPTAARYSTADNTSCIHLQTQIRKFLPSPNIQSGTAAPWHPSRTVVIAHNTPSTRRISPLVLTTSRACKKQARGPMMLRSTFHPLKCLDTKLGVSVFVWVRIFSSRLRRRTWWTSVFFFEWQISTAGERTLYHLVIYIWCCIFLHFLNTKQRKTCSRSQLIMAR